MGATNKVVDVEVPDPTGDRPELYLLSVDGVYRVVLSDYIDSIKQNNILKNTATQ